MDKRNDLTDPPAGRDATDGAIGSLAKGRDRRRSYDLPPASDLDDDLLLRYADNALTGAERDALETRLLTDLDARDRLGILVGGLAEGGFPAAAPPDSALVKASRFVFHVVGGALEVLRGQGVSALQPAHAVRSASLSTNPVAYQILREFQTAQGALTARVELHAARAEEAPLVDLVVHVGAEGHPAEGVRVKLIRDGRPVDSREVEPAGCTFLHLGPARYALELRKGGVEVGRMLVDLRG